MSVMFSFHTMLLIIGRLFLYITFTDMSFKSCQFQSHLIQPSRPTLCHLQLTMPSVSSPCAPFLLLAFHIYHSYPLLLHHSFLFLYFQLSLYPIYSPVSSGNLCLMPFSTHSGNLCLTPEPMTPFMYRETSRYNSLRALLGVLSLLLISNFKSSSNISSVCLNSSHTHSTLLHLSHAISLSLLSSILSFVVE